MQVFLNRREIRRQVRAALGQTTDEGLAAMNREALDDTIGRAALMAHADMRPLRAQTQATFPIGAQQSLIDYPDDAGPGSLREASLWDDTGLMYWPLRRKRTRTQQSDDQALAAGGQAATDACDTPRWIAEEADGWKLYPTSDKAYQVRIGYSVRQLFFTDDDESTVDGQLIISYAMHLETRAFDAERSKAYLAEYQQRKMLLKGMEQAGAAISIDPDADFDSDQDLGDTVPRWDTRPSRQG